MFGRVAAIGIDGKSYWQTKKDFSLRQIFDLETIVATHCVNHGDFKEGVRALLIDKDKNPKWRYDLENMPKDYLDEFFGEFT